jgi:hypothetical protein
VQVGILTRVQLLVRWVVSKVRQRLGRQRLGRQRLGLSQPTVSQVADLTYQIHRTSSLTNLSYQIHLTKLDGQRRRGYRQVASVSEGCSGAAEGWGQCCGLVMLSASVCPGSVMALPSHSSLLRNTLRGTHSQKPTHQCLSIVIF